MTDINENAAQNTDRHLWPETHAVGTIPATLFVTEDGHGIGINVGGHVVVKTLEAWHELAIEATKVETPLQKAINEAAEDFRLGHVTEDMVEVPETTPPPADDLVERLQDMARAEAAEMADDKEYFAGTKLSSFLTWKAADRITALGAEIATHDDYKRASRNTAEICHDRITALEAKREELAKHLGATVRTAADAVTRAQAAEARETALEAEKYTQKKRIEFLEMDSESQERHIKKLGDESLAMLNLATAHAVDRDAEYKRAQAAEAERDEAYGYATRLLDTLHPGLEHLPDAAGVLTQIDNTTVGLKRRANRAEALAERRGEALDVARTYMGDCGLTDDHSPMQVVCAALADDQGEG